jgi:hypothetical protein
MPDFTAKNAKDAKILTAKNTKHAKVLTGNFVTTIRASEQQNLGHPSCGGLGKPIWRGS